MVKYPSHAKVRPFHVQNNETKYNRLHLDKYNDLYLGLCVLRPLRASYLMSDLMLILITVKTDTNVTRALS